MRSLNELSKLQWKLSLQYSVHFFEVLTEKSVSSFQSLSALGTWMVHLQYKRSKQQIAKGHICGKNALNAKVTLLWYSMLQYGTEIFLSLCSLRKNSAVVEKAQH